MRSQFSTRRGSRLLAVLLGLMLIAAACGGNDDDGEGADDTTPDDTTAADEGDPVQGGRLVYGLEADVANPWTPQNVLCDISCHMVMRTVFDTLTLYATGADGNPEVQPNLLESFSSNDDFTEWTLTPRDGIMFHDGTPFDAEAIKVNLEGHLSSLLTGTALQDVESIEVADGAAVVTMSRPWAHFPIYLSGQIGYMASPTWLAAVADGSAPAAEPVGTGAFVYQSYEPGGSFVAARNDDYWRTDEGLPHLDEVELRVIADVQARRTALENGDINMTHTSNGEVISALRDNPDLETTESSDYAEANYVLLNVANPDSAISDVRIRRAMAMAIDLEVFIDRRAGGVLEPANGPFGPGQLGELDDTGYPEYDPEEAQALVEEYKEDNGIDGAVPISYTTTSDPINLGTGELLRQFWDAVGFETEIAQIEQGQFIGAALQGDVEAFGWRNHGGYNPDSQRVWWHSSTALCGVRDTCPDGGEPTFGLNFGRIRDDQIDASLDSIRETDDVEVLREEAENINRRFGEQVYNLWTTETVWMWAKHPAVNGLDLWTTPDGQEVADFNGIGGTHGIMNLWCTDGTCR